MSAPQEPYVDPSGNTEAFKAFVARGGQPAEPVAAAPKKKTPVGLVAGVVAAVIAIVVIILLAV